jgi:hypothetical protein
VPGQEIAVAADAAGGGEQGADEAATTGIVMLDDEGSTYGVCLL